ncbi:MAG: hypothetical protein KAJ51_07730, partial [Thermoplasmata archaeon]|nr:hypothetical protein [Thermoplasmata archaeon]
GNSEHASQYYFDGIIDEVRIWNKALSTKEIQAHYEEYEKNKIPVADAGSDILVEVGQVFSLDASGSYDLDGYIIEYYWDFNVEEDSDGDGIKDNDHDREGVNVSWKYTKTGVNIITLIVIDDQLATSKDTLKVIVKTTISIFNPLEDGFSFDNPGWTLACFDLSFEEAKTILMSDEFHHYLDEGSTSALKYWFIYLFAKVSHRYGHCYGMSALAMNYYKDYLPTPGGSTSYELSYNQISSDIEYYHNWQVLNVSTFAMLESWGAEGSPINDENQWGLIKTTIESGEPIIIGLQSDRGRHAVIGYAFDENGDVLIYDPSDPATEQNPTNYIDITELNSDITIQYQWDDGTTFNSWIALS